METVPTAGKFLAVTNKHTNESMAKGVGSPTLREFTAVIKMPFHTIYHWQSKKLRYLRFCAKSVDATDHTCIN